MSTFRRLLRRVVGPVLISVFAASLAAGAERPVPLRAKPARSESVAREARASIERALQYLEKRQAPDGSWGRHPAVTALVVDAMVQSGLKDYSAESKPVKAGLGFIRTHIKKDGGIYASFYANYSTSICLMALYRAGRPEDEATVRTARAYLLALQSDAGEKAGPKDPSYGGFGYEKDRKGGMRTPDLSNTQWTLEALKVTEPVEKADEPGGGKQAVQTTAQAYEKAQAFLARCQNLKSVNDQPWAGTDGGFVYRPAESKAGEEGEVNAGLRSYGSMTYAGLKSMVYARVDRNDKRVVACYEWLRAHWTLEENPGLGKQGLFYYYQTLAKALNAYGREVILDTDGKRHDWRTELTTKLLSIQEGDGSWSNKNSRWMEAMPELVTTYCVLSLEAALSGW